MEPNNQYATSKVQEQDFTSGWKIAFIIAGTGVSLPVLYLGAEIALGIGYTQSMIAFGISTLILTALCFATTLIGNRSRLSTYMILRFPFGEHGAKIINAIVGVSLLGWFSVSLELLALAVQDTLVELIGLHLPIYAIIIITSIFITVTTIYGVRSIERLANLSVPILTIFLLYVLWLTVREEGVFAQIMAYEPSDSDMTLFGATSTLIGASVLIPVLMADFSRFIKNDKQSLIAVLGLAVGTPLVYFIGAVTSIQTGELDIILVMKSYNLVMLAFVLLFVSTWLNNATNLYSTVLTFSTIKAKISFKNMSLITSLLGTTLALLGFTNHLFGFLDILGVLAPSVSSIYILDFFWLRKQDYQLSDIIPWGMKGLISWALGSAIALMTYFEFFQITHAHFVDSFLIAGGVYYLLNRVGYEED